MDQLRWVVANCPEIFEQVERVSLCVFHQEAKVEFVSTPETRQEANVSAPSGEPPEFGVDMESDSNPYELLEVGQSDDSEDDLD